jgi:hypothetical protein
VIRERVCNANGQLGAIEYTILEQPRMPAPEPGKPERENPILEKHEQAFEKSVQKFLEEIQKSKQPRIYRGRQTLKQLAGQNAGPANIEISDQNIQAFSRVSRKYHVDFVLKKDITAEQLRYLFF